MDKKYNIQDLNEIIENLRKLSGNAQLNYLKQLKENEPEIFFILTTVFHKAYNKKMNKYYVNDKKLNLIKENLFSNKNGNSIEIFLEVLNDLEKVSNLYNSNKRITGNQAIEYIINSLNKLDKTGQNIVLDILDNDLKVGLNIKTLNKVLDDKLPITPYHGGVKLEIRKLDKEIDKLNKEANKIKEKLNQTTDINEKTKLEEKLLELNLIVDEKMDGMYCAIGKNFSESRQGTNLHIEHIFEKEIDILNNITGNKNVLIGELLLKSVPNRKIANGIINSYTKILDKLEEFEIDYKNFNIENINKKIMEYKDDKKLIKKLKDLKKDIVHFKTDYNIDFLEMPNEINYIIWDLIPEKNYYQGFYEKPLIKRRIELDTLLKNTNINNIKLVKYILTRDKLDIAKFTYNILTNGGEGTMIKNPETVFENNKSPKVKKVKIEITVDLEIIGFLTGTKKSNKNKIESFICKTKDNKLITRPKGISDKEGKILYKLIQKNLSKEELEQLQEYLYKTDTEKKEKLINNIPTFLNKAIQNIEKEYGTRIIEVKANGLSQSKNKETYSLEHPSFIEIRKDKKIADTLEDVKDNFKMHQQVIKLLGLSEDMLQHFQL